jgi:ABC-type antimicrobial peptide transport system permease subunit
MAIRLRNSADAASTARQLADSLRQIDPQLSWQFGSMRQQILDSESLTLRRPVLVLSASFAVLALILALVGVFGVMSYSVSERTREIGIRVALGAVRSEIANLVLRETLMVTTAGLALGAFGAFVITQFLPTSGIGWSGSGIFLYRVSRTDPVTYTGAAILLATVAVVASWLPARRATRVDPLVALRHE